MADQKSFHLVISKVGESLYDGDVVSVVLPGGAGEMTLLANHEALISSLKKGDIQVRNAEGDEETVSIESGILEVSSNQATVLV